MTLTATTHLNFHGEARDALAFYATAFGGRSTVTTYGDLGMPAGLPDSDKVVFGAAFAPNGFTVMAYDVPGRTEPRTPGSTRRENGTTITDEPFFLALGGASLEEVTGPWEALSDGATVIEPLAASAWSAGFGMLTDRFGVTWAVSVTPAQA
ncbi:VOC family protein [Labedella phragmitis]|uniref:VOC family protein n=1 Tax=Labedella phragmitis TaxID=2498849 RepID=A0A444PTG2_9MICO|nr:VOC family protein [Labedella phragmitis]RWZ51160.1 VOC family protein [Labedella phragmitis]